MSETDQQPGPMILTGMGYTTEELERHRRTNVASDIEGVAHIALGAILGSWLAIALWMIFFR